MASARLPGPSQCKVLVRLLATALVVGFACRVFAGGLPSVVGDCREINLLVAAVREHVPLSHSRGTPE
jgi:hypothetical protein